jgi:hypothetical protein
VQVKFLKGWINRTLKGLAWVCLQLDQLLKPLVRLQVT